MRSEIPQIQVITGIGDADLEDYVAQLLFTQGWSIIFRAFDWNALVDYMKERSNELRTVIVYTSDTTGFVSDSILTFGSGLTTFISLDDVPRTAHEIMQKIRGQLRLPLVHSIVQIKNSGKDSPQIQESPRKIILVTGSSGAPGKTSMAIGIADSISVSRRVTLLDIDFRSIPLKEYYSADNYTILSLSPVDKPKEIPPIEKQEIVVVDIGVLPPIHEVVEDRRWFAVLLNSLFDSSTHLVYVAQTTKQSLMQLDQFMREISSLTKKIPITYICISVGQAQELRKAQAAFTNLVTGERSFILSQAQLRPGNSGLLDNLLTSNKRKEIATIAASLL